MNVKTEQLVGISVVRVGETRLFPNTNRGLRLLATALGASAAFLLLAFFVGLVETGDKRVKAASDFAVCPAT